MSIKETIEANIDDIRSKIEGQAKTIKSLLREALAQNRVGATGSMPAPEHQQQTIMKA